MQGGDELILNGLLGEPAPAGPLEAMLSGGFGKVALLQPLPALAIAPRRRTMGLTAGPAPGGGGQGNDSGCVPPWNGCTARPACNARTLQVVSDSHSNPGEH